MCNVRFALVKKFKMKERIEAIIQHERLSPSQFADAIGVQRSGISHILSGRNKPSVDFLNKLLTKFPHLSGDWLITGLGTMHNGQISTKDVPKQLELDAEQPSPRKPLKVPSKSVKEHTPPVSTAPKATMETSPLISALANEKTVERIVVFYSDKSFSEYKPE